MPTYARIHKLTAKVPLANFGLIELPVGSWDIYKGWKTDLGASVEDALSGSETYLPARKSSLTGRPGHGLLTGERQGRFSLAVE